MRTTLRTKLLATAALGAGLAVLAAGPASAADTTTTFTLTGGTLTISAPGSADLTSTQTLVTAASLSGSLGTVTVTDNRGAIAGTWTASASSTDFTTGSASADELIAKADVSYTVASPSSSGTGVDAPVLVAQTLGSQKDVFVRTAIVGPGSTSWDPTISVSVPTDVVAGTYSGTITHSVA